MAPTSIMLSLTTRGRSAKILTSRWIKTSTINTYAAVTAAASVAVNIPP